MSLKRTIKCTMIIMFIFLLMGCNSKAKPVVIVTGTINANGTYVNDFFGFSVDLPMEWELSDINMDEVKELSKDIFSEDMSKSIDYSIKKTQIHFQLNKYPLDYYYDTNPSIICISESVSKRDLAASKIRTAAHVLENTKKALEETGIYTFNNIALENIGGKEFYVLEAFIDLDDIVITQKYYSEFFDNKKYILSFVITYHNENERNEIEEILQTIDFTKK